jgi:hypothetical protein
MKIVHPAYRCGDHCRTPLYHALRDDGYNDQIVHVCEHLLRDWYPDAPEHLRPAAPDGSCTMTDAATRDVTRDAFAMIRACLDEDIAAAQVIYDNCNPARVLAQITGIAVDALIHIKGEDGTREWLDLMQRLAAGEA